MILNINILILKLSFCHSETFTHLKLIKILKKNFYQYPITFNVTMLLEYKYVLFFDSSIFYIQGYKICLKYRKKTEL